MATDGGSHVGTWEHAQSHVVLNTNAAQADSVPAVTLTPASAVNPVLPPVPPVPERHEAARGRRAKRPNNGVHMLLSQQIEGYEYHELHPRTRNLIDALIRWAYVLDVSSTVLGPFDTRRRAP